MRKPILSFTVFSILFTIIFFACNNDLTNEVTGKSYPKKVIEFDADKAASLAQKIRDEVAIEVADDLEVSVWASDTLVQDPIAISVAPDGRIYYTRGSRQANSEFDVRGHRNWMTASISFQSVEDRRAFLRKTFEADNEESTKFLKDLNEDGVRDWKDLTVEKEQIWFVSDESNDGVADRSQLYLEDFSEEITDVANGVEFHDGEVYIAVGPDVWRTKDMNKDSIADKTTSISHGYAVHIGFSGHGMSGVTMGPDGRIWWGIGDIGMNVVDKSGKHWKYPNRGVVVRSEPDGSNFEVFCMGVRNTHEFVFDKYGNLISVDNDGDHSGERERLVYLINGSDTGWRINWQFGKYTDPDNNSYKVWMDEKMAVPRWEGQASYFLPPIQNYVNGPTGMVYNPGTALSPKYKDHFFVAEFRGTPTRSPIHAFTLKSDGAGFALNTTEEVVKGLLPTGLDFGSDGALYFGDWINGWGIKDEGRIWKLDSGDKRYQGIRRQVKLLLQSDFSTLELKVLERHLEHQDMRVRTKAQFALVKKGSDGFKTLQHAAFHSKDQLGRIHGLWGMAQMARYVEKYKKTLTPFLTDVDVEICAQATRLIGDVRYKEASADLIKLLQHESPRVQFFAMEALGRTADENGIAPIIELLRANDGKDMWLKNAGMIALGRIGKAEPLMALNNDESKEVRVAAVVALRRMEHVGISNFLNDKDEYIVAEAARGINDDFSIEAALPALANVLKETRFTTEPLLRRAINANLRVGKKENVDLLVEYANRNTAPEVMRAEAIAALSTWGNLSVFDRVDGRYRGEVKRDWEPAKTAFSPFVNTLLQEDDVSVQVAAAKAVSQLKIKDSETLLLSLLKKNKSEEVRTAALSAIYGLQSEQLENALELALADKNNMVRSKALELLPESKIAESKALQFFDDIIKNGSEQEQQSAITSLGSFKSEAAVQLMSNLFNQYKSGKMDLGIQLDLVEAIEKQNDSLLVADLKIYETEISKDDDLALFRMTLQGGNEKKGHYVFYEHDAAQCTRCHAIWEYGGNAGPGLNGVATRLSDEELLNALIHPSKDYALGYEIVSLTLNDDSNVSGIVMERNDEFVKIKLGKEDIQKIQQSDIKESVSVPSSMIPVKSVLSKKEIRDLIRFLKDLTQEVG